MAGEYIPSIPYMTIGLMHATESICLYITPVDNAGFIYVSVEKANGASSD